MTTMQRHEVFRSDRIQVTEDLIGTSNASRVLEIGAGDYSFDYMQKKRELPGQRLTSSPLAILSAI